MARRRARSRPGDPFQALLYGRWLYAALALAAAASYLRLYTGRPARLPQPIEQAVTNAEAPTDRGATDLTWAEVAERLQERPGLAIQLGAWTGLLLGLALAGVFLTIQAVRSGRARHVLRYRTRIPLSLWSYRDVGRILLLVGLLVSLWPFVRISALAWGWLELADNHLWGLVSTVLLDALLIAAVAGFAAARPRVFSGMIGRAWRQAPAAIAQGLRAYVTLFPWIVGLLWLIVTSCERLGIQPPVEPIHELLFLRKEPWVVTLTVILACVIGPVAEEVFFRGVVFSAVRRQASRLTAMLVSGSVFAAVHTNLVGFLPILLLGCLLAERYERTGSLFSPIAVHMVHNTLLVGLGLTIRAML